MKIKLLFISSPITRKIMSAYIKKISGWQNPLIKILGKSFYVETYSWEKFLHYNLEPFKVYFFYILNLPALVRKLKQFDIIVVQGYPAIIEIIISTIISKLTKKILIVTDTHWYWPQTLKSKVLFPIYVNLLRKADGIFVPGIKSYLWWLKFGFKPYIIHYYWLETDMMECINQNKYAKLRKPYTLLYLGRLIPKRAVDLIIRAFNNFIKETGADAALLIAGDGPLRPNLKKIVKELNLDEKVVFLGAIPESEKQCLYKISDLFIYVPIKTSIPEEWPIPPLEALKVGIPVIVSDVVGSIPDIKEGLIVIKSGDIEALTKAMILYYENPSIRRSLALQGQKKALSITPEHVYKEFLKAILNTIEKHHKTNQL